jgi:hypothetical protein
MTIVKNVRILVLQEQTVFGEEDILMGSVRNYSVVCESPRGGELVVLRRTDLDIVTSNYITKTTLIARMKLKLANFYKKYRQVR